MANNQITPATPLPPSLLQSCSAGLEEIKHLMTGHKGNSEFCFPEILKQNSLFP